jgi:hypothetical protein
MPLVCEFTWDTCIKIFWYHILYWLQTLKHHLGCSILPFFLFLGQIGRSKQKNSACWHFKNAAAHRLHNLSLNVYLVLHTSFSIIFQPLQVGKGKMADCVVLQVEFKSEFSEPKTNYQWESFLCPFKNCHKNVIIFKVKIV